MQAWHRGGAMIRVLVLDDEPGVNRALARILARLGAHAVVGPRLAHVEALRGERFDVVVGDVMAMALCDELFPQARRCLLASWPSEWSEAELVALRVTVVLTKPWTTQALRDAIFGS